MLRCEISSGATAFCSPRSWKDTPGLPENSCFPECRFEFWLVLFFFSFKSFLSLLQYCFCFMFCFVVFLTARHVGSWLPNQGSNLHPLCWKAMNHQGNPLIGSWRRKEKKMADDLLIRKHRRMKGTTQVIESDLLFCVSPSLPLLWLPHWVHLCFSCCWGLRFYSRGAGMTELRCRIKEIRTGGLGGVQKLMGLFIRETSETISHTQTLVWD